MCYSCPQSNGDLKKQKEEMAGKTQRVLLSMPTNINITGVPNFDRRAAKVERAACAIWECTLHFRLSFVHVFNGYVASLSMTLTKIYDL